jgi:hypothetical protein
MSLVKLLKFTDFMMNVQENMETAMYGNVSLSYLTIYP